MRIVESASARQDFCSVHWVVYSIWPSAMASGIPVVASDSGGNPEAVDHGRTGLLVPPGDPQAIADALRALIADRELMRSMGLAGREKARASFGMDRMMRANEELYGAVLARNGRGRRD